MSNAWSWFVIVLVVLNIAGCVVLLWWTGKRGPHDPKPEDTSHYWDGDITEYNKPMPRWWINMFYLTIVFAIGYLVLYPGFGNFAGTKGWTSANQVQADSAVVLRAREADNRIFADKTVEQLSANTVALEVGRSIFINNCTTCHGSAAKGAVGFPDLTDTSWQWGSTADEILSSIQNGRTAAMPAWEDVVGGASGVSELVSYVKSFSSGKPAGTDAAKSNFETLCVACHGETGKGNPMLGAPDLTDSYWLYGNSDKAIAQSIAKGRNGAMPSHLELLGDTRSKLVAAFVYSMQSQSTATPVKESAPK